jgi:mycothiol synthase
MKKQLTQEPQLVMRRDSLAGLPAVALPEGFHLAHFRLGDEAAWESIIGESFGWSERAGKFDAIMRADAAFRAECVLLVRHGDRPVATASAWHRASHGPRIGYLHYVGVLPAYQGKRLGLHVSLACLHVMSQEGRTAAVLQTDDSRVAAIKTYLRLGFTPVLVHENQRRRWRDVLAAMDRPESSDTYRETLDGPVTPIGA